MGAGPAKLYLHLVRHSRNAMQVESFRVKKQTTLAEFKQMVAEKWGIAVERQRFWMWATRQNRSVRPSTPLAPNSDENRVCDIRVSTRTSPKSKGAHRLSDGINRGATACSAQVCVFPSASYCGFEWTV